ncbi:hypothetical protein UFOVP75_153 [uncultured Caudovirales phage]|uniref:Uncharacterized protein n=1 Tax=uncultured Caudovirales phage TaxID=2100421 RepID=A0A6J5KZ60_9CAUD|nr:hypothetical protein UFOVP75_153 [uncultured Caudovirales phage]
MGQPVKPSGECVLRIVGHNDLDDVLAPLLSAVPNQSISIELDYDNFLAFYRLAHAKGWEDQLLFKGVPDGVKAMWGSIAIYIVKPVTMWVRA